MARDARALPRRTTDNDALFMTFLRTEPEEDWPLPERYERGAATARLFPGGVLTQLSSAPRYDLTAGTAH